MVRWQHWQQGMHVAKQHFVPWSSTAAFKPSFITWVPFPQMSMTQGYICGACTKRKACLLHKKSLALQQSKSKFAAILTFACIAWWGRWPQIAKDTGSYSFSSSPPSWLVLKVRKGKQNPFHPRLPALPNDLNRPWFIGKDVRLERVRFIFRVVVQRSTWNG